MTIADRDGNKISIHAPARGATRHSEDLLSNGNISIHAPARGATMDQAKHDAKESNFNPRSREGSDGKSVKVIGNIYEFQSTLPRGERHRFRVRTDTVSNNFNPRSREGSDEILAKLGLSEIVFQSTLPRGERLPRRAVLYGDVRISIHAPARGATVEYLKSQCMENISIHAPARGATVPGKNKG